MIYDKKVKVFSIIGLAFIIVFCSFRPSFAEDLSNNWEYVYTNFGDLFERDIDYAVSLISDHIRDYSGASDTWDNLISQKEFLRCYFYIPETDGSSSSISIYCYPGFNTFEQGVMNYYNFSNFPCYTNVSCGYLIQLGKSGNSLTVQSSVWNINIPCIFYGYSTQLLVDAVQKNSTDTIGKVIEDNLTLIPGLLEDTNNSIKENTEKQEVLNNWITDENVTSDVNLPENGLASSSSNSNVNGFFSRVCDLLSSSFTYSDNSFTGRQISIGSTSKTINSDYTRIMLTSFLGSSANTIIVTLVGGFWFFLIVWFVYNDIRKQIDKVSNFTFVNESINTDLL